MAQQVEGQLARRLECEKADRYAPVYARYQITKMWLVPSLINGA
jgi:hypothetical protein